ncbi:hypothetical protein EDD18DRAFT_53842 [Armillaria luteobubalina]|uniref:Uncharacterized protein n=1 Tax=Armillaria luteobubalina TaxID=153913 RepID=A0AA39QBW3_9AGAR|nr:hypothetical protein EDD18DRAFT_53842 [Armillaria luteobubalina]
MKFTAQFTILTAALFTFVVATPMKGRTFSGLSTTPSLTRRDNGCSKKKTCNDCIKVKGASGNLCGFSSTDGCVELSQAHLETSQLAKTTADCKSINSEQNTQQPDTNAVDAAWNGMKTHVFGGGQKGTAGTHLTKAWKAKDPKADFQSNKATGLSVTKKVCTLVLGLCIQYS